MSNELRHGKQTRSWAVGISLLLHGFVLVGLGAGSFQGNIQKQNDLVVYLAMPSVGVFQNPKAEIHTEYPATPEPPSFPSLEPNSQELQVDQVESRIEQTSIVKHDEINLISEENEMETLFPEEKAESEPERLPAAEVDPFSNSEELMVVTKFEFLYKSI